MNNKTNMGVATVLEISEISTDMMDVWIQNEEIAKTAKPGQFISIYCQDESLLLPRPISICEIDAKQGRIRLVFRVVGKGTKEFSTWSKGDSIRVMGPLGNGFTFEEKPAVIMGGGVGIPPLLELAKQLRKINEERKITIILGYRNRDLFLKEEFEPYGEVFVATEDGSIGTKGNVMNALQEVSVTEDMIYACGPKPMLKAIKEFAGQHDIKAQISMEEKMACGIGACLACVCKSKEKDEHSNVHNKRVCKDGPVFYADEIELDY